MAGPDDGASSRKRKRAKKTRGPAAAATSAATPVALGETAQGLQLRHRGVRTTHTTLQQPHGLCQTLQPL